MGGGKKCKLLFSFTCGVCDLYYQSMARFILIFTLFVFIANAANASAILGCCEKKQEQSQQNTQPPCHQHTDKLPKTKAIGGCLCTYMSNSQISMPDHDMFQDRIVMSMVPIHGDHDVGVSVFITPESPPPKA